jgi:hypothetical protein
MNDLWAKISGQDRVDHIRVDTIVQEDATTYHSGNRGYLHCGFGIAFSSGGPIHSEGLCVTEVKERHIWRRFDFWETKTFLIELH